MPASVMSHDLPEKAAGIMEALHKETQALVMLSILDGSSVLFLKNVGGYDPYRQIPQVGEHCPVHACAAGKVLVAFLPDEKRAQIRSEVELTRFTDHTVNGGGKCRKNSQLDLLRRWCPSAHCPLPKDR